MKSRYLLVAAFLLTGVVFATSASQVLSFEKTQGTTGPIKQTTSIYKNAQTHFLSAPSHYAVSMQSSISMARVSSILSSSLPGDSCVQAISTSGTDVSSVPFVDINSTEELMPASTNKLFTAAVVLSSLDPTSTLDTSLVASKKSSTLSQAYIRTSGDPSFVSSTTPPTWRTSNLSPTHVHTFDDLAKKAYAAGVRTITNLTIDNTWFKLAAVDPGWTADVAQVGQIGAFNVDEGFAGTTLAPDVTANTVAALEASFTAQGITIGTVNDAAIPAALADSSHNIATTSSAAIRDLMSDTLKTSDNVFADELLAASVHVASGVVTPTATSAFVQKTLTGLGLDTKDYVFVNAAGYSKNARATCTLENYILQIMKSRGIDLAALSSVAGKDGTLLTRFTNSPEQVSAKTGTLDGVTALTGTLGSSVQFSFIANGNFTDDQGHTFQDDVVSALSHFPNVTSPSFSN